MAGYDSALGLSTWCDLHTLSLILNASVPLAFKISLIFILAIIWNRLLFLPSFLSCSFYNKSPLSVFFHMVKTSSYWVAVGQYWPGVAWTNHLAKQVEWGKAQKNKWHWPRDWISCRNQSGNKGFSGWNTEPRYLQIVKAVSVRTGNVRESSDRPEIVFCSPFTLHWWC